MENKIFDLKIIELLVKPDQDENRQNQGYIVQIKVKVQSKDLNIILNKLKLYDNPIINQVEISKIMKLIL